MQLETFVPLTNILEHCGLSYDDALEITRKAGIPGVFTEASIASKVGNLFRAGRSAVGGAYDNVKDNVRDVSNSAGQFFDTKAYNANNKPVVAYDKDGVLHFMIFKDLDLSRLGHKEVLQGIISGLKSKYEDVRVPPVNDPLRQMATKANTTVFEMPDNNAKDRLVNILKGLEQKVAAVDNDYSKYNFVSPQEFAAVQKELHDIVGAMDKAADAAVKEVNNEVSAALNAEVTPQQAAPIRGNSTTQTNKNTSSTGNNLADKVSNFFIPKGASGAAQPVTAPSAQSVAPVAAATASQPATAPATATTIANPAPEGPTLRGATVTSDPNTPFPAQATTNSGVASAPPVITPEVMPGAAPAQPRQSAENIQDAEVLSTQPDAAFAKQPAALGMNQIAQAPAPVPAPPMNPADYAQAVSNMNSANARTLKGAYAAMNANKPAQVPDILPGDLAAAAPIGTGAGTAQPQTFTANAGPAAPAPAPEYTQGDIAPEYTQGDITPEAGPAPVADLQSPLDYYNQVEANQKDMENRKTYSKATAPVASYTNVAPFRPKGYDWASTANLPAAKSARAIIPRTR